MYLLIQVPNPFSKKSSFFKWQCSDNPKNNAIWYSNLSANWTFSLSCVPLIKSGSLNWPWSTKILGQFVTCMRKFIIQSDVKRIMTSPMKTITSVLTASTDIITNILAHPIRLTEILVIMSVSTFKIVVVLICLNFLKKRLLLSKISSIKTLNILILQLKPWQEV